MRRQEEEDQNSKMFQELSSLVLNILKSPPAPLDFSDFTVAPARSATAVRRSRGEAMQQISLGGFASMLFGISFALMLCGSLTFLIGFMMMPWVLGLVFVFYVVGIVSSLSMLARAILFHTSSSKNDCSSWKLL